MDFKFGHFVLWCQGWYRFKDVNDPLKEAIKAMNLDGFHPTTYDIGEFAMCVLDQIKMIHLTQAKNQFDVPWSLITSAGISSSILNAIRKNKDLHPCDNSSETVQRSMLEVAKNLIILNMPDSLVLPNPKYDATIWLPELSTTKTAFGTVEEMFAYYNKHTNN